MADVTVTSLEPAGDNLRILGTNFTQTTTIVYVDDVTTPYEFSSATEISIPMPNEGAEIIVEKAGVQTAPQKVPAANPTEGTAGGAGGQDAPGAIGVVDEGSNATGPMTPSQPYPSGTPTSTQVAPPPTPEDYRTEQEKDALAGVKDPIGEPVEPVERVVTVAEQGIDAKTPYPIGNPPDPDEAFRQAHGFSRRAEEAPREVTGNLADPAANTGPDRVP